MIDLSEVLATLEAAVERRKFRRLDFFQPYDKQRAFYDAGIRYRERLLMAGNQVGKTEAGAYETAVHLTGEYPEWWLGRRWDRPTRGWAAGESSSVVRDVQQKKLIGEPGVEAAKGTGFIPRDAIIDTSLARGITDALDTVMVKHISGGTSVLKFKSYEQGRTKFQGDGIDFGWCDEEPPHDIYSETLTRTNATGGMLFTTFTPLKGMTDVVGLFLDNPTSERWSITMTIEDAKHISPEERAKIIAGYRAWERDARTRGVPMLGEGRVFQISEDVIQEPAIQDIPAYWTKIWGIDFGIEHKFAAVLLLWDRDNDVMHVHHVIRMGDALPMQHAAAIKPIGANVPVAWPQDGTQRDKGSGEQLSKLYKAQGLLMLPDHATWPDGGNSLEAGIIEMDDRFRGSKLKVASHLSEFFEEFRIYHRKNGQIVKVKDDILSACRYGLMMKRFAKAVPLGASFGLRRRQTIARDVDFDLS